MFSQEATDLTGSAGSVQRSVSDKDKLKTRLQQLLGDTIDFQIEELPQGKFKVRFPYKSNQPSPLFIPRQQLYLELERWSTEINKIRQANKHQPISVENKVDAEGPPRGFQYTEDYTYAEGLDISADPLIGCECSAASGGCLANASQCCAAMAGALFAYDSDGYLQLKQGYPIYECNSRCSCGPGCHNRTIQRGCKQRLVVFRTMDRGWGVRTKDPISKGSFIMEYIGEIIGMEEADRRGQHYDARGKTYLLDLDYNDGEPKYAIDAAKKGNIAHFVNHSCDPNMAVFGVWIDHLNADLPRIAFFSTKDIEMGQELTFDYHSGQSVNPDLNSRGKLGGRVECKCGSRRCRKWIF